MMYKTPTVKPEDIERKWYVIDVSEQILGRVSTKIAEILSGKTKVNRSDNLDCGDYVIIINAKRIKLSRNKASKKEYFRHSGYPGGKKFIKFSDVLEENSDFVIRHAVKNMLPNNKLRNSMLNRLYVYAGSDHKHEAQKPIEIKL